MLSATSGLFATATLLVDGSPRPFFGFVFGHAFFSVAIFDVFGPGAPFLTATMLILAALFVALGDSAKVAFGRAP